MYLEAYLSAKISRVNLFIRINKKYLVQRHYKSSYNDFVCDIIVLHYFLHNALFRYPLIIILEIFRY